MASLLRRTRRGAARTVFGLLLPAIFLLAGCSSDSSVGRFFGALPPEAEPPAAEGRPYPNLATVPRPPVLTPRAEREAELAQLQADQAAAAAADRTLRSDGTFPVAPPPAPALAPAVSEAPAVPAAPAMASPVPMAMPAPATTAPAVAQARPAAAAAAAPAATTLRRVGAVAFARDGAALSAIGERALGEAAALARANNGRVRLIPAQVARQTPPLELARARHEAIVQVLGRAGVARERVGIDDGAGRRVDVYDLYVEY